MVVSLLDSELSPECLIGVASLSPIFTETVIGFLFFGGGVSGVLLPLALLLLLVTLLISPLALLLLLLLVGTCLVAAFPVDELLLCVAGLSLLWGVGVFSEDDACFDVVDLLVEAKVLLRVAGVFLIKDAGFDDADFFSEAEVLPRVAGVFSLDVSLPADGNLPTLPRERVLHDGELLPIDCSSDSSLWAFTFPLNCAVGVVGFLKAGD